MCVTSIMVDARTNRKTPFPVSGHPADMLLKVIHAVTVARQEMASEMIRHARLFINSHSMTKRIVASPILKAHKPVNAG